MRDQWLIRVQDKTYGPVTFDTLKEWQREGRLIATNEVRNAEWADWRIAGTLERLFPSVAPAGATDERIVVRRRNWNQIVRETMRVYRRGFVQMFLLSLLTAIPAFLLQELVPFSLPAVGSTTPPAFPHIGPQAIALLVILIALWPISTAGLQLVADGAAHGQRLPLREVLRHALTLWPRILVLALFVYGSYFFWLAIPFAAMLSLVSAQPTIFSLVLVLLIGAFTVYMNARLFVNFLFWQQTGSLTGLHGIEALRESKHLARSRAGEPALDRPLYRGGIVASVWLVLLFAATIAIQLPFTAARFFGVSDPAQVMEIAQKAAADPGGDALTLSANILGALLHVALRPLLAAAFIVLYYDARAGASR